MSDKQMDRGSDEWMDEWTDKWTNEWTDGWTDGPTKPDIEWLYKWSDHHGILHTKFADHDLFGSLFKI